MWPILIFFFNKVIVGPMNSALCLLKAKMRTSKKEKKEEEEENAKRQMQENNSYPNIY